MKIELNIPDEEALFGRLFFKLKKATSELFDSAANINDMVSDKSIEYLTYKAMEALGIKTEKKKK